MVTLYYAQNQVQCFKEEIVYDEILPTEAKERSMLLWLRNLRIHSFEPRHFENINPQHYDNIKVKSTSVEKIINNQEDLDKIKSQEESTNALPSSNDLNSSVSENLSETADVNSSSIEEPTSKRKKI